MEMMSAPPSPRLALGPLPYYWPRQTTLAFYAGIADGPVDLVYLGETVCARRHELRFEDWLDVAQMLATAGKTPVLSTLALIESESDLKLLRKLVARGEFAIEANDMAAVRLLAEAGRRDWIAGPSLNVFNPHTLALLRDWGACGWVVPPELSGAALSALLDQLPTTRTATPDEATTDHRPPFTTEVLAWGRLPLAHSARCFTARHFNLQKDTCEFRCLGLADGLPLATREGEPFLTLNGVQTQSARIHNLLGDLDAVTRRADVLRIQPQGSHTPEVIALFDDVRRGRLSAADAFAASHPLLSGQSPCNGFWHGRAGLELHAA